MLPIERVIHAPHLVVGNSSSQLRQRLCNFRMLPHHLLPHHRDRLVRRKIMPVVLQHEQIQRRNQSIGRVSRGDVNHVLLESAGQQSQIHHAWSRGKMQSVRGRQSAIPVRPFHELVAKSGAPLRGISRGLRQRLNIQAARLFPTNLHRKRVVESQRRTERQRKPPFVFVLHPLIDRALVSDGFLFQDGRYSRSRVFGIHIDSSRQHCLLADVSACEIEAPFYFQLRVRFDLLRHNLAQQQRLGKILGADGDPVSMGGRARRCQRRGHHRDQNPPRAQLEACSHRGRNRFSNCPSPKSASNARAAAGIAPARMSWLFTIASPPKINSPTPPAPIAAAIVASPTEITTATRTPDRITFSASGSCTRHSSCRSVSPIPRPASTTAGSTPRIPVYVLRITGSNAYRVNARIASRSALPPSHGTGSRNPNSARLGIV